MKLIIDDRERAVFPYFKSLGVVPYEVRRLTTSDYAIIDNKEHLIAVIERKTLDDFAASFKDGRHDNVQKLLEARKKTNCAIFYVIEGPAFPDPDTKFGRIPYSQIESSIFHLMVRDNIGIIRTQNVENTLETLSRLVRSMMTLGGGTTPAAEFVAPQQLVDENGEELIPIEQPAMELLTERQDKPIESTVSSIWCTIRGITVNSAPIFMAEFALRDLLFKTRLEIVAIAGTLKQLNGRKFSAGIVDTISGLPNNAKLAEKMLGRVPGVSPDGAVKLLATRSLRELIGWSVEALADLPYGKGRIGIARATAIKQHFEFKLKK